MWYDSISRKTIGYCLTKNCYDTFINKEGDIITKQYWSHDQLLEHTYSCKWFQKMYPPAVDIFDDEEDVIDYVCTFQFTTNGILYNIGEYYVYGGDDVECKSFEHILVDYENE